MLRHRYLISTVQVWCCREDLQIEGREGRVACSLTLLCAASPFMQRYCTQHTTLQSTANCNNFPQLSVQRLTLLRRIVSGICPTSSPLHPLGLATVIVPDFSSESLTKLLDLLKKGTTTIDGPQVEEVVKLARVLELRELEEEVKGRHLN